MAECSWRSEILAEQQGISRPITSSVRPLRKRRQRIRSEVHRSPLMTRHRACRPVWRWEQCACWGDSPCPYSFMCVCCSFFIHTWDFLIFHRNVRDVYLGLSSVSLWQGSCLMHKWVQDDSSSSTKLFHTALHIAFTVSGAQYQKVWVDCPRNVPMFSLCEWIYQNCGLMICSVNKPFSK